MPERATQIVRGFRLRYIVGLSAIALLSCIALALLFHTSEQERGRAQLVKQVADQSAASQRVAFFANALLDSPNISEQDQIREELLLAIHDMRRTHNALTNEARSDHRLLQSIKNIYFNESDPFDAQVRQFLRHGDIVAAIDVDTADQATSSLEELNLLGMNTIMQTHDIMARIIAYEADAAIQRTEKILSFIVAAIIILLILEAILIFEPIGRKVRQSIESARQAELKAQREAEKSRRALNAKANFLRVMSHELRTPLNAVVGMTSLLQQSSLSKEQKDRLQHLAGAGLHLQKLVNRMLELNSITGEGFQFRPSPCAPSAELALLVQRANEETKAATSAQIQLSCDKISGRHYMIDAAMFRTAISNVIDSLRRRTDATSIRIHCIGEENYEGACIFQIELSFDGAQFDAHATRAAIARFEEKGIASQQFANSADLSLVIASNILESMDGSLEIEDAKIVISFAADPSRVSTQPLSPKQNIIGDTPQNMMPTKALVADDNLPNRLVAKAFLENAGYVVVFAENGEEAIEACEQDNDIGVIFMDIDMPVLDGLEATRRIRAASERGAKLPIIALTAHALQEDEHVLLSSGLDDILKKPVREADLLRFARQHIQRTLRPSAKAI